MKTKLLTVAVLLLILAAGGVRFYGHLTKEPAVVVVKSTPVGTVMIKTTTILDALVYEGRVAPKTIEQVSFKSSARLESFNGQVGQVLEPGHILAQLDTSDLQLAVDGAQSQLDAANAEYTRALKGARAEDVALAAINVDKAEEGVTYLQDRVSDVTQLFDEGIVSKSELDGLELELALAEEDLALARKNYEKAVNGTEAELIEGAQAQASMAQANLSAQTSLLEDATYKLMEERILLDQLYEPGELVPAGYPVAILRSLDQSVTLGVSSKDLLSVFVGQEVRVIKDSVSSSGQVVRVAEIPDESHFLYEVEVCLDEKDYLVGDIVECHLTLGTKDVITVPISAVLNDGIDYVYLMKDGIATVQKIQIIEVNDGMAVVEGLEEGDTLIISNLNRIHEQSPVHGEVQP